MLWRGAPVMALALVALSALMLPCAAVAAFQRDWTSAQAFSQSAGLGLIVAAGFWTALRSPTTGPLARTEILSVIGFFAVAPIAAATPVFMIAPSLGPAGAYFEMVSTMTTTGATVFADLSAAPDSLHLWRALTAWLGGFVTLMAAAAVFAPRNLGGYEVEIEDRLGPVGRLGGTPAWAGGQERSAASDARLDHAFGVIAPVYLAFSAVLAGAFASMGQPALEAVVHAAGVISTTGITVDGRPLGGLGVEALAFFAMALAASRHTFGSGGPLQRLRRYAMDPELELAAIAIGVAVGWVFLRHWFSVIGIDAPGEPVSALRALWGALFTALSFLTTTGYISEHWAGARAWSGLSSPGMLLLGLAAMGGGVASTAGGVKLLRSFALYQQGLRELDRLVEPRRSQSHGRGGRRVGFAGAALAWVFVMLFLLALGAATLGLTALGVPFERALAAAVASLSNAGPAFAVALGPGAEGFSAMSDPARMVAAAAMVVGRVEVLAVVALANPAYWRR